MAYLLGVFCITGKRMIEIGHCLCQQLVFSLIFSPFFGYEMWLKTLVDVKFAPYFTILLLLMPFSSISVHSSIQQYPKIAHMLSFFEDSTYLQHNVT